MPALAIPLSRLWAKALIRRLLLYEAGKQDAVVVFIFNSLQH